MNKTNFHTPQFLTLLLILCCSCSDKLNSSDFVNWIENPNNGLTKTQEIGSFIFEAKYRPNAYEKALATINNPKTDPTIPPDDFYYFTLKAGHKNNKIDLTKWNAKDKKDIQRNIYYLSFTMQNDIKLIDGKDTLKCVHHVFERSFNISNAKIFNIGFEPQNWNTNSKTLLLNGDYFETQPIKFTFQKNDFETIPDLEM